MTPSKPWRMSRISQVVKRMKKVRVQTLAFMYMDQEKWFLLFEPQSLRLLSGSRITCSCLYCMEKAMATHSSTLAWEIPWMEEPGRLQSMGLKRAGHDWATSLSLFIFMHWRRKWQPNPVFLPGESQGWEPRGLLSMGSHRVGHDCRDLAAAAAYTVMVH